MTPKEQEQALFLLREARDVIGDLVRAMENDDDKHGPAAVARIEKLYPRIAHFLRASEGA